MKKHKFQFQFKFQFRFKRDLHLNLQRMCELTDVRMLRRSADVKALNIHRQVDVKLNELAKQILMLLPLLLLLLLLLYVLHAHL